MRKDYNKLNKIEPFSKNLRNIEGLVELDKCWEPGIIVVAWYENHSLMTFGSSKACIKNKK